MEVNLRMNKKNSDKSNLEVTADFASSTVERLTLRAGELKMEIDPAAGARIVSFSLGQTELLTPSSVHPENYGSTFWDAPQTNWNWPPRAALDSEPYSANGSEDQVELTSQIDPTGLQFSKRIRADLARQCFEIDYGIRNCADQPVKVGPWEVTRVAGGLSFFPYEEVAGLPPTALEPVCYQDGICWYAFDASYLATGRKLFSGAREGWLAHLGPDRSLFVKTFPDTQPGDYAPEQAEVEIWGHDGGIYVELENHGCYRELAPGQTMSYKVVWHLRRLPENLDIKQGSADLVQIARQVAANSP